MPDIVATGFNLWEKDPSKQRNAVGMANIYCHELDASFNLIGECPVPTALVM